ncbi:metallophosphoesterase [Halobaculum sp. MBLA0147]|uniref:metallophosphoesterase n=1 Tax=Halobaculum sp. MBLA0147 TaxID=3079934 RepID=UPI00352365FB
MSSDSPQIRYVNDLERAYDDPERIGRVAQFLTGGDDPIVLDGGDSTALGALSLASDDPGGEPTIESGPSGRLAPDSAESEVIDHPVDPALPLFDAVEPDVHVPGNHDLDAGDAHLEVVQSATAGQWLAANLSGTDAFDETAVFERAGDRVGIVGVTHPAVARMARLVAANTAGDSSVDPALSATDPVPHVHDAVDSLEDRGVDHSVVVSHCGGTDETIARQCEVDLILGGHDHRHEVFETAGTTVARTAGHGRAALAIDLGGPTVHVHDLDDVTPHTSVTEWYDRERSRLGLDATVAAVSASHDSPAVRRRVCVALRRQTDADLAVVPALAVRGRLAGTVTTADLIGVVPFRLPTATVTVPRRVATRLVTAADDPDDPLDRTVWDGADPERGTVATDADPVHLALVAGAVERGPLASLGTEVITERHGQLHELFLEDVRSSGW